MQSGGWAERVNAGLCFTPASASRAHPMEPQSGPIRTFVMGLLLADPDGIDPHLAARVMTESAVGSPMLKARVPLVLDHPEETWFDVSLMHKDIRLALAAARVHRACRFPPRRWPKRS